jgi:hypothetical protein
MPALALLLFCQLARADLPAQDEGDGEPSAVVVRPSQASPPAAPEDDNGPAPYREPEPRWIPVSPSPPAEQLETTPGDNPAAGILASLIQLAGVLGLQVCGLLSLGGLTAFGGFCVLPCSLYSAGLCAVPGCALMVLGPYAVGALSSALGGALLGFPRATSPSETITAGNVAEHVVNALWPLMVAWAGSLLLLHITAAVGVASVFASYLVLGISGGNGTSTALAVGIMGGVALLVAGALGVSTVAMVMGGAVLSWLRYHSSRD